MAAIGMLILVTHLLVRNVLSAPLHLITAMGELALKGLEEIQGALVFAVQIQ